MPVFTVCIFIFSEAFYHIFNKLYDSVVAFYLIVGILFYHVDATKKICLK